MNKSVVQASHLRVFVRSSLLVAAPLLLMLSSFGIWRLFNWAAAQNTIDHQELSQTLFLAILPILLLAFLSAVFLINFVRGRSLQKAENALASVKSKQNYHQDFVRIVADNRPGATMIVDGAGRIWFANAEAAKSPALPPEELVGMPFEKMFPENEVLRLLPLIKRARGKNKVLEDVSPVKRDGQLHYIKSQIIPLPNNANMVDAVMVNEDDITSLLVEREARERTFRQVIDTLVAVVDKRDPYASGHSIRVGQVARRIAECLKLDNVQIETAEIAGLLMNFGKVLVPRAILVKAGALSTEELKQVHDSLLASANILALIGFSQPVVPTLRQVLEHYDGSGTPQGLSGEDIMLTARIVSVANAFVALLSARAHRPSLSVSGALEMLSARAEKIYDARVIDALAAVVANNQQQLDWLPAAMSGKVSSVAAQKS
jgi:PAS domain S-box-containing protein